jgi:hypothetical protein
VSPGEVVRFAAATAAELEAVRVQIERRLLEVNASLTEDVRRRLAEAATRGDVPLAREVFAQAAVFGALFQVLRAQIPEGAHTYLDNLIDELAKDATLIP